MTLIIIGDQLVNLDNVVSLDADAGNIVRIWYIGSATPVTVQVPAPAAPVVNYLRSKGLLI